MSPLARWGTALLVVGTILAALGGSRLPTIHTPTVLVGLVLLAVGTIAVRRSATAAREAPAAGGSLGEVLERLRDLPAELASAAAGAEHAPLPALAARLADLQRDAFDPVSERAPGLVGRMGGPAFAGVFDPYASAERALGRARSAATDGHREEALASLSAASDALGRAVAAIP